jgi:hypothetical protein
VALDAVLGAGQGTTARLARLAVVVVIAALVYPKAIPETKVRQTNVDLIAGSLRELPDRDLVLVYEWYCGASFSRYYRGQAPWVTLPPLDDLPLQRIDLFKRQMTATAPIQPVLDAMQRTLAAGNRVWLVGGLPFLGRGEVPPDIPPAPNGPWGWDHDAYSHLWGTQAAYFIQTRAGSISVLTLPDAGPVASTENLPVLMAKDWRGQPDSGMPTTP